MFKAILIEKDDETYRRVAELDDAQLPPGNVLVDVVQHAELQGWPGDHRQRSGRAQLSMVPGIDFAGTVAQSADPRYAVGDAVVLNGWGVGEQHWGGLAQTHASRPTG
jgi:acrylyl-CoA reductase (NADPH)